MSNPNSVTQHAPSERSEDKLVVARNSVYVTIFLIGAKLAIGVSTGSLAILSQAADSGFDLIAVLITLYAVRVSAVPPDEDHAYGHGKFESLSALLQGILLLGITAWIAVSAISHLSGSETHVARVTFWSFTILIVSIALDLWRATLLRRAGKAHNSPALEASALNFFTDILSAIVALIGLALVKFADMPNADDWAALCLCLFVGGLSVKLSKRAIDGLTDRFASASEYSRLKSIVEETAGVESVSRLRIRQAGPSLFVEASIEINRVLPFASIERIVADVQQRIRNGFDDADVTIHWKPVRTDLEAPFDTLKVIIAEFGILPHNIELSETSKGVVTLDYHLEFPPGTKLVEAQKLSEAIEERVREELPQVSTIFVHLEEERSDRRLPIVDDITADRSDDLREISFYVKAANEAVRGVRNVHLLQDERFKQLKLMLTVDLDVKLTLSEAHEIVTNIEEELRKRFPELSRIVIHANAV